MNNKVDTVWDMRLKLVCHWLYNFKNKKPNSDILLISFRGEEQFVNIKKIILGVDEHCNIVRNNKSETNAKLSKNYLLHNSLENYKKLFLEDSNIIMASSAPLSFNHFKIYEKPVLFLGVEILNTLGNLLQNIESYSEAPAVLEDMRYLFYIEQTNPIEFVKNENIEAVRNFLYFRLFEQNETFRNPLVRTGSVIKKTNFEECSELNLLKELINRDLILLENKKILTSRLAVVLYRVATLDTDENITAIGRFYSDALNLKSKNFYSVYQEFSDDFNQNKRVFKNFKKKSFKGYELGKATMSEYETRKEIAKKLLQLKISELDMQTIAVVTNLSKQEIDNMIKHPNS
ncbi:MAG: hypothetical protein A2540_06855 [Sulfurimonas sp. RIFOXYD2_FULL_37_8]|nr:MAG: hypothetical protein A2540_06855 [Sulfurimonas sp. RIFOXYD2_FULL_37_8]